jgi:hypothetical protein
MLWAAPMERSSRSEAATVTATAIWVGAGMVIITDGVEAEGIITAGGITATEFHVRNSKEVASAGGLFHFPHGFSFSHLPSVRQTTLG